MMQDHALTRSKEGSPGDMSGTDKKVTLLIVTLGAFLTPYMSSAVNVALPVIGTEFKMSAVSLSWIATAYLLSAAIFLLPFGRLADIRGRKKVYTYGVVIYTISALLLAHSSSELELICYRLVEGFGAAMLFGSGIAMLTSVFPPGERGRVLGINVAAVYFGLSMGPLLGGFLTEHFGWRSVFLVNVPLGTLILILVCWRLKGEWAEAEGERFDLPGTVLYSLALAFLVYGLSLFPAAQGFAVVLTGGGFLAAFALWEMRVSSPLMDIRLLRNNRVFAFSNAAAFLSYSSTYAVVFFLSLYLQYVKGFSPESAGLILVAQPAVQAVFSPTAGRLSDRIDPRLVASAGMTITVAGLILLLFLGVASSLFPIMASLVLLGLGFAFFASPNTNAIMSSVPRKFYGVASGSVGTMRLTGQMFSQAIALMVSALYLGSAQIVPENYPQFLMAMRAAFAVLAVLCSFGIFFSLARGSSDAESSPGGGYGR
jgi:EmrB/QacA subfamily drug resistance transporter